MSSGYTINGRHVPSVTTIIRETVAGAWMPDQYYLQRGTAIHACCALVAQNKAFRNDPAIDGWVAGCRRFFLENPCRVIAVERRVESRLYQYGGRLDAVVEIGEKAVVLDWKSGEMPLLQVGLQLAGYGYADTVNCKHGMAVTLNGDGTYKTSGLLDLKQYWQGFLACRTVYGLKLKLGTLSSRKKGNG